MKVKELKKILEIMNDDAVITTQNLEDFVHLSTLDNGDVILSTEKPIGYCSRTGARVFPTKTEGYTAFCPELDEDLYNIEIIEK